ncbi:MAG: autotransporter-associated beta strand repeat-containing protein [Verrucomicrobiota bacterium]
MSHDPNPLGRRVSTPISRGGGLAAALVLLAAAGARAGTVTDDFSTSVDYLTAGVSGTIWDGIYNQPAAYVLNTTGTAGQLTIGTPSSAVGWDGTHANAPFLYKSVTGDFDARVQTTAGRTANYTIAGLLVRLDPAGADGDAGEDFVNISYQWFNTFNQLRSVNDNVQSDSPQYDFPLAGQKYLRLTRSGNVFRGYTSSDGISWTPRAWTGSTYDLTRADLGGTVQVGLTEGAFVAGNATYAGFDNFSLITPDLDLPLTWANGADGNWTTGTWSGGPPTYPASANPAIIDTPWNVTVDSSQAAASLAVSNGGSVSVTDTGTLVVGGLLNLTDATLSIAAGANFTLPVTTLSGGTLSISGTHTLSAVISLSATSTVSTPDVADSVTISGALAGGAVGLTKTGDGALLLSNTGNSYTGTTTVNGGTLAMVDAIGYNNTIMGPVVINSGGTLRWDGQGTIADSATVTVNGGILNLQSGNDYISTLTLSGGAQVQGDQSAYQFLIVNGSGGTQIVATGGGDAGMISSRLAITSKWGGTTGNRTQEFAVDDATALTITGPIVNTAPNSSAYTGSVLKSGTGTLTLTGTNTYSGATTVNDGALIVASTGGLTFKPTTDEVSNKVTGTGAVTLDGGFTIDLSTADATVGNSWTLVDVTTLTATFGTDFHVVGFTETSPGSGVWTQGSSAPKWTFTKSTGKLTYGIVSDYDNWAHAQGLTGTAGSGLDPAFNADPNKDGIQNGMAWILGAGALGNPASNLLKLPAVSRDETGALILTFDRLAASQASAPMVVQYADDPGAGPWTELAAGASGGTDGNITIAVTTGGGSTTDYDRISVTIPATYMATHPKTFARLMAAE